MFDHRDGPGKWLHFWPPFHSQGNRLQNIFQVSFTCIGILEKARVDHRLDCFVTRIILNRELELHIDDVIRQIERFARHTLDN